MSVSKQFLTFWRIILFTFSGASRPNHQTVWPWRRRQYDPSKHQRLFSPKQSITPRRPQYDTHYCLTMKTKTVWAFKTSATIYPKTQHHTQKAIVWHSLLCASHRPSHGSDSSRPLAMKVLVHSKASACGRKTGIVKGCPLSTSVFHCQCHSDSVSHSAIHSFTHHHWPYPTTAFDSMVK